jgi:predicted thioesterase
MLHSAHNGPLFECKCLGVIRTYLSSNSQTIVEKVVLNSLKEMVPGLPLNFSIFLEELLPSMVYMGVQVMVYSGIYSDGVKANAVVDVPHLLTSLNEL